MLYYVWILYVVHDVLWYHMETTHNYNIMIVHARCTCTASGVYNLLPHTELGTWWFCNGKYVKKVDIAPTST